MKKFRIKDTTNEMSTTGTGASFTSGQGEQYASPKSFRIKKDKKEGIDSPFDHSAPSIPNRPSKAIDYKQLFEENETPEYKAQTALADHPNYDKLVDILTANGFEVQGKPYTDATGRSYVDGLWNVVKWHHADDSGNKSGRPATHKDINSALQQAGITDIVAKASPTFKFRLTLANKPIREIEVGDVKTSDGVKTTVRDIDPETGAVSWKVEYVPAIDSTFKEFQELNKFIKTLAQKTEDTTIDSIADQVTKLFNQYRTHIRKNYPDSYKRYASNPTLEHESLNEARYSQFKKTTEVRTPTEQIHRAVREIRRKIDEITKVVGHTERMKNELKASNEGMSYLKRTRNAINKISEKIQELNNRIKGLTE